MVAPVGRETPLNSDGTGKGTAGLVERHEEAVALLVYDAAAVHVKPAPQGALVPGEQIAPSVVSE